MILIRSLLYFIFMVVSIVLIGLPIALIGWLIPFRWRCLMANFWGTANLWMLSAVCGLNYRVEGLDNLPSGSAIILSKHQSTWETIALRCLLPPEQAWVLKRELMWIPVFGWALALVEPIAIDRKSGKKAVRRVIEQGLDRLSKGRQVVIFPEGTRVAPGTRKRYGLGGALLAEQARQQYPLIPIAHNAGVFWRRRGVRKYPGTIQMVIGPPIDTEGLGAPEINQRVEEWIESNVAKMPQTAP